MFSIPLEELHGYGMLFATEVDIIWVEVERWNQHFRKMAIYVLLLGIAWQKMGFSVLLDGTD